jgi:hypothetical protein
VCNVGSRHNAWLQDVLHIVVHGIHIVYVARGIASAVLCKMATLAAIEAWSLRSGVAIFLLHLSTCHVIPWLGGCGIGVSVVALILSSVVWCPGVRQIHQDLHIIVGWAWCISRIIYRSLLLLLGSLLLILLWASFTSSWSELILILPKCIVEGPQVR